MLMSRALYMLDTDMMRVHEADPTCTILLHLMRVNLGWSGHKLQATDAPVHRIAKLLASCLAALLSGFHCV